jgi:hypothetical protein
MRTDAVTEYIYRHYPELLTDAERSLSRLRDVRLKAALDEARTRMLEDRLNLSSWEKQYPDLHAQVESGSVGAGMNRAAQRVLTERGAEVHLNTCPHCQALCLTPRAKACLECGHTWHAEGDKK